MNQLAVAVHLLHMTLRLALYAVEYGVGSLQVALLKRLHSPSHLGTDLLQLHLGDTLGGIQQRLLMAGELLFEGIVFIEFLLTHSAQHLHFWSLLYGLPQLRHLVGEMRQPLTRLVVPLVAGGVGQIVHVGYLAAFERHLPVLHLDGVERAYSGAHEIHREVVVQLVGGGIVVPKMTQPLLKHLLEVGQFLLLHLAGLKSLAIDKQLWLLPTTVRRLRYIPFLSRVLPRAGAEQGHKKLALSYPFVVFVLLAAVVV